MGDGFQKRPKYVNLAQCPMSSCESSPIQDVSDEMFNPERAMPSKSGVDNSPTSLYQAEADF